MGSYLSVRAGRVAALCALIATSSSAFAEGTTPPRIVRFVPAEDPRGAGVARVDVSLVIDIDAEGAVTDARVEKPGDTALDEAARTAARQLVFEPAMRDGRRVASRIRYRYVFEAHPAPAAASEGAPETGASEAAAVEAAAPEAASTEAASAETAATASQPATPEEPSFGATARVRAPSREITTRRLERSELASVAGTRGDPVRGIELMPGVGRTAAGGPSALILRGANPFDSQVFLEGAPVPSLFHIGGFTSFVHARVTDAVELYPSNFSVRYGRKVGGVVEVRLRDPRTDALHGIAELSLLDSSVLVEAPVGRAFSFLAAARRSNIDAVLNSAQNTADLAITAAPVYWDYQSVATYKPTDDDRVRLLAYGSGDRFAILNANPTDGDPALRGAFDYANVFHRVQLGYRRRLGRHAEQNTEMTYGRSDELGAFGAIGRFDFATDTLQGRSEWSGALGDSVRITVGLDALANHFSGSYRGIPADTGEGDPPRAISTQRTVGVEASTWVLSPGAYAEVGVRPVRELLIKPGVRADYNDFIRQGSVDPRLTVRFDATARTAIKAGVGRFSQAPEERHVADPIGNPNLRMTHALHASAGIEHQVTDAVSVSVEGFAKYLERVVTATPDGRAPFFTNAQTGRVFGGELFAHVRPGGDFSGFFAYTLMRSERRDVGQPWRLFDRDQPHTITAAGTYRLGRGWEAGATVRYASGTPYTPVASATYDATLDVYAPRAGRPMSARNPAFSRIDVRVQKTWTFSRWSLAAYLDVQNALNAPNREGFAYAYDYSERRGTKGLPILPILGLRGEL